MADRCQQTARKRTAGKFESGASTQTSRFIPLTDSLSANSGYSVSLFHCVVLTVRFAGHNKHLAWSLHAHASGGMDLPEALQRVGGLNST
jgi:hypothetical protein